MPDLSGYYRQVSCRICQFWHWDGMGPKPDGVYDSHGTCQAHPPVIGTPPAWQVLTRAWPTTRANDSCGGFVPDPNAGRS